MDTIISKLDVMSLLSMETLNFRQILALIFFFVTWAVGIAFVFQTMWIRHDEHQWEAQDREALLQGVAKDGGDG